VSVAADQHHHRHHRHGNNAVQDRAPVEGSDRIYRGEIHGDAERDRERDRHVESLGRRRVRLAIALYGHVVRVRLTGAYPPNELFQCPPPKSGGAGSQARGRGRLGQKTMAMTMDGKNRIMIYGPKD
jgi:hypothetical protein